MKMMSVEHSEDFFLNSFELLFEWQVTDVTWPVRFRC